MFRCLHALEAGRHLHIETYCAVLAKASVVLEKSISDYSEVCI